jgi:endonuclease III
MASKEQIARILIERHGMTYAEQAGIRIRDAPSPLYQLLVLSTLLSARISADIAVAAARELFRAGYRTPRAMQAASWQDRVDALGRGHYRRYDERTSTMLGNGSELILQQWKGDLRRLHKEGGDAAGARRLLQEVPGIGPTGASIFCREVQGVWPSVAPYLDDRTIKGAVRVGLPTSRNRLAALVPEADLPHLAAACVRASLSKDVAEDVRSAL